jgi:hypothetical protein
VFDVMGNGRTVVKVTANRYNAPLGVDPVGRLNPISAPADTRQWLPQSRCNDVISGVRVTGCDRNGDLSPTLDELGTAPGYVFAGVNSRTRTTSRGRSSTSTPTSSASCRRVVASITTSCADAPQSGHQHRRSGRKLIGPITEGSQQRSDRYAWNRRAPPAPISLQLGDLDTTTRASSFR